MQIEKLNENQLAVTFNIEDLNKKNISLHSFMCNSSESQTLFFDILNIANEKIGFNLNNYEVIIEAFSVPAKSTFVLFITRVPKVTKLHLSTIKYGTFKTTKSFWLMFNSFENLCMFCNSLKNNFKIESSLYFFNECYFLHININKIRYLFSFLTMACEFSNSIYNNDFIMDENAKIIAKNSAIKICNKYFA